MLFAELKVQIYVDENKLTSEQKGTALTSDTDISVDHPLDVGVSAIIYNRDKLLAHFAYLGKGKEAVTINIED